MRRREFMCFLGGVLAAWPRGARAQQGKLIHLGYLEGGAREDTAAQNLRRQFVLGMRDLGYVEGRDYMMEERYAAGQMDRFMTYAQQLIDLPVDVIVAGGCNPRCQTVNQPNTHRHDACRRSGWYRIGPEPRTFRRECYGHERACLGHGEQAGRTPKGTAPASQARRRFMESE